jgi:hypothetical protein
LQRQSLWQRQHLRRNQRLRQKPRHQRLKISRKSAAGGRWAVKVSAPQDMKKAGRKVRLFAIQ